MPHIVVREPGRVVYSMPLRDGLVVGRQPGNDLVLSDRSVSREHVRFQAHESGLFRVVDCESSHGTRVNGERIQGGVPLVDGDKIELGQCVLTYRATEESPDAAIVLTTAASWPVLPLEGNTRRPSPVFPDRSIADARARDVERKLDLFYRVGRVFSTFSDSEQLLREMLDTILDVVQCERGVVGLFEGSSQGSHEASALMRIARVRGQSDVPGEDIVISRSLIDLIVNRRANIIVPDDTAKERPRTMVREGVLSAIGAPLATASRVFGFIYLDDRGRADRFTRGDVEFLSALAHLTASAFERSHEFQRMSAVVESLRNDRPESGIVGSSEPARHLLAQIQKYARAHAPVLIHGESGSGKELVARTLHALSPRADGPLVTVNCAAIPDSLIESELFGHEKGAFTGATRDRRGKFVIAHDGSLFLDEIGDLSLAAQAKVLRAIEDGELQPLGSERPVRVDVRIISATHKDLRGEVAAKRFREDLFYRLSVVEIRVPPLRDRRSDVAEIANLFLLRAGEKLGKRFEGFTLAALQTLREYGWPGNVRELHNEVERAAIGSDRTIVDITDLSERLAPRPEAILPPEPGGTSLTLAEQFSRIDLFERRLVQEAMRVGKGNISEAARLLGITRIMMKRRLQRIA